MARDKGRFLCTGTLWQYIGRDARLLCIERPVWLVDEPTSGLDKASGRLFAALASSHLTSGGILVAATHLPLGIAGLKSLHLGESEPA